MEDNQLNAAELRREKRRQKILSGSNERMKRIMGGYSAEPAENVELESHIWTNNANIPEPDALLDNRASSLTTSTSSTTNTSIYQRTEAIDSSGHNHKETKPDAIEDDASQITNSRQTPDKDSNLKRQRDPFSTIRTLLLLFVGILVRLSFCCSFGDQYVQSMVNPFVAVEVIIIGYQKAADMDMGENITGGIWLSTLVLIGVSPDLITIYKTCMGLVTGAALDFTLYFFGFMITHIIL